MIKYQCDGKHTTKAKVTKQRHRSEITIYVEV